MPILSPDSLSFVDIALLIVFLVVLPLESVLSRGKTRRALKSGAAGVRAKLYRETIIVLWAASLPVLAVWWLGDRSWTALGFQVEATPLAIVGWALAGLVALFFVGQQRLVARSSKAQADVRTALKNSDIMDDFMPHTRHEYKVFHLTGLTAGITEEIIFRGYLLWSLSLLMPLWAAASLSLGVFTLLHLYQGLRQLVPVFVLGGIFTAIVLLSGSLWPAIILHILVDVMNNKIVWTARSCPAQTA